MSGISGFPYDIFISYAHLDNKTPTEREKGWVELFKINLEITLDQMLGRVGQFKFWFDNRNLDGSMLFDNRIKQGIEESAIMLCISSPSYFNSKYCTKERNWFIDKADKEPFGIQVEDRHRMVNLFLNQIPRAEWPEDYQGRTGFPFYDAGSKQDLGIRYLPDDPAYIRTLNQLAQAIYPLLRGIAAHQDSAPATASTTTAAPSPATSTPAPERQAAENKEEPEGEGPCIFLAEVSDTLRSLRKRTIQELQKEGIRVLDALPPPYEHAAHAEAVKNHMEEAVLSVHLLNEFPGREIDDKEDAFYSQEQANLGLQYAKNQLIWVPRELDLNEIEEESYRQFISSIDEGALESGRLEYIKGLKSELPREVSQMLANILAREKSQQAATHPGAVLLDTHINDQLYAFELCKTLLEQNIQPYVNPQEDDPRKNLQMLNERISQVNQLIFLYGSVSRDWVHERIKATLQHIIGLDMPPKQFYIYLFPDRKNPEEARPAQQYIPVEVLDNSDSAEIKQQHIEHLIHQMKGGTQA